MNGSKTSFVWNGENLAAENKTDNLNTYTYDMTGVHIANQNGTVTSYFKDFHGNIAGKTTKTGEIFNEMGIKMDYDAFGNQWIGDVPDPFGYCGEYLDSESNLIYLRNRYYNSTTGRFITEDPVKDGLNWYAYAGNNPIMFVDSLGLARHVDENGNSTIQANLDWDRDGFLDTEADRARFDANNNRISDWIEAGYSNIDDWNSNKEKNILSNFTHVQQSYGDICWAASLSMVIKQLTGREISDIKIAQDKHGMENYNHGAASKEIEDLIIEENYLDGSNYEVDKTLSKNAFTPKLVKDNIDAGIPIMIGYDQHMRVIIGYDYSDGKQRLILDDPAYSSNYIDYGETIEGLKEAIERPENGINISGIIFKRVN